MLPSVPMGEMESEPQIPMTFAFFLYFSLSLLFLFALPPNTLLVTPAVAEWPPCDITGHVSTIEFCFFRFLLTRTYSKTFTSYRRCYTARFTWYCFNSSSGMDGYCLGFRSMLKCLVERSFLDIWSSHNRVLESARGSRAHSTSTRTPPRRRHNGEWFALEWIYLTAWRVWILLKLNIDDAYGIDLVYNVEQGAI